MKIIIAVPDFTREAHLKKILPGLLAKLNLSHSRSGIGIPLREWDRYLNATFRLCNSEIPYDKLKKQDIEILIATGLHRAPTKKEINANLGNVNHPNRVNKIKISVHDYKNVAYFGKSKSDVPIYLNKKLKDADSIITIGVVEPHLYAGYSGGVKVVAIGLAGEKTINLTHHPKFLDHAATRICSIKNNPFQDFIQEVGHLLPITHSINIVNDKNGGILKVFEGQPKSCFKRAIKYSEKIFEKKINYILDVIICGIPAQKGINIYQASRIFNYIVNVRNPVIKNTSLILVKADLKEGFGKGLGEKRFMEEIMKMTCPKNLIDRIKKKGCLAGEHRAYMAAKALLKAKLGFISEKADLYKNKGLPFLFFKDLAEVKKFIGKNFEKPKIYYLKNAFNTILNLRK